MSSQNLVATAVSDPSRLVAGGRSGAGLYRFGVPLAFLLLGTMLRLAAYALTRTSPTPPGFVDAMCVWDCAWYADIAAHGYQAYPETLTFGGPAGIANWAFFPLYPMLLAGLGRLVPLPPASLGMVVSPLLTYGAVVAAWPLLADDRRAYALFAGLLLAGPFSFYFAVPYSESLFLLLTVVAFARLGRGDFFGAGLAGGLLSATRTVGVLFLGAMLVGGAGALGRRPLAALKSRPDIVFGLLLVPAGLCAFMAWLYFVTGDALAFVHIQRGWDRVATDPVTALWTALTEPIGQVRAAPLMALAGLAGLALSGGLAWRRELPAAVFCALAIVLALTQGVESLLRFVAALAPLNLLLARLLARPRGLFWLSLLAFAVLDFVLTLGWMARAGALM